MLGFTAPPRPMSIDDMAPVSPPAILTPPALSGSFFVGQTLLCGTGLWSNDPVAYEYKWQKNGVDLGDTDNAYLVTASDDGGIIKCLVRAQNAGGWSAWQESNGLYAIQLGLWLDAADLTTIAQTAGLVSGWTDKSGNAQNIIQSIVSRQPVTGTRTINALNALDFDGADDSLIRTTATDFGAGDYTTFCVISPDTASSSRWIIFKGKYWGISVGEGGGTSPSADCSFGNTSSAIKSYGPTSATGTARILGAIKSGSSQFLFASATDYAGVVANSIIATEALAIGSYNNSTARFDGMMGEILVSQRALSNAERNQVASYLVAKWGVSWTGR